MGACEQVSHQWLHGAWLHAKLDRQGGDGDKCVSTGCGG